MSEDINEKLDRIEMGLWAVCHRKNSHASVLITGGTGTLGCALTRAFLDTDYHVTILNRSEAKQAAHRAMFQNDQDRIEYILADICNYDAVLKACTGQDIVIHAAALKRVDIGETEIAEFTRVNIDGTKVVADCAMRAMVERAIFISSDKAVAPINFYGMTKAIGERIWLDHNDKHGTIFNAVRYGNVMGSNGSVLQLWRDRITRGLPIIVREPETTRFFMTLSQAVGLVQYAFAQKQGACIFVPTTTPAFALYDLARMVEPDREKWVRMPLGPREKQHERLIAPGEYYNCEENGVIRMWPARAGCFTVPDWSCSEKARRLTGEEVVKLLE